MGILVLQNAAKQLCGIEDTEFGAVFASSVRAILASSSFVTSLVNLGSVSTLFVAYLSSLPMARNW